MEDKIIKRTPCIGVCSTTYGDDICRGCRRFRHEITSWINYSDLEKNIINRRLEKFKIIVLEEKFDSVTIKVTATREILDISFADDFDFSDKEEVEDLLLTAVNRAMQKAAAKEQEESQKLISDIYAFLSFSFFIRSTNVFLIFYRIMTIINDST